jgi:hypothetical protein
LTGLTRVAAQVAESPARECPESVATSRRADERFFRFATLIYESMIAAPLFGFKLSVAVLPS